MNLFKYLLILLLSSYSFSLSQNDSINHKKTQYKFTPQISGGQIEATTILYVLEVGGLVDLDLITDANENPKSFGLRFGVEYYSYFEAGGPTGGGPFTDYCLYGGHTIRMNDFWLTFLGGVSYHTYDSNYYDNKLLFRAGLEFKYNLIGNEIGLLLKGSTSFQEQTFYFGIGIFIGYFK